MRLKVFISYFCLIAALTALSQFLGIGIGASAMARLATVESLVERGTAIIEGSSLARTPDKVLVNGHFYGGQLPFLQYAVAPLYGAINKIFGLSLSDDLKLVYVLITLSTVGLLSSLMISSFYHLMSRFGVVGPGALLATATLGLGTLVLPYSTVFNTHIIVGSLIFFSLYFLFRGPGRFHVLLMGLLVGAAVVIDPAPGVIFCFALLIFFSIETGRRRWLLPFCMGLFVPVAIHCIISLRSIGMVLPVNIFPGYYRYPGSIFDGTNLSGVASHGSMGAFISYSYHSVFGRRGLFSYNPVLLFPSAMLLICAFSRRGAYRSQSIVILSASAAVVVCYLVKTVNYGGWAYGMRFFVPIIPAIAIYLGPFLAKRRHTLVRVLFGISLTVSVIVSAIGLMNPWSDMYIGPNPIVNNLTMAFGNLGIQPPEILSGLAMSLNKEDSQALYYLGRKFDLYGWRSLARDTFVRAVQADASNSAARLALANVCYELGDLACARREYDSLRLSDPGYMIAVHEYDIARCVNVIRVFPEDIKARRNMALLLVEEGSEEGARDLIRDYLEKGAGRLRERYRHECWDGEAEVIYPPSRAGLILLLDRLEIGDVENLINSTNEKF